MATGHLVRFVVSSWKAHEAPLAHELVGWVEEGEVLLADRGVCSWALISLFKRKGVDVVMRLHHLRKTGTDPVQWPKAQRQGRWEKQLWSELPASLNLCVVRFRVETPGFRTEHIAVVTTLLDEAIYPDAVFVESSSRWFSFAGKPSHSQWTTSRGPNHLSMSLKGIPSVRLMGNS